jgi:PhnB protein
MQFHPYLAFAGSCREAFTRYQAIFGGDLMMMSWSEMPADPDMPVPPDKADLVMHAALTTPDTVLMGADDLSGEFDGRNQGTCCTVSVADVAEATRVFGALADGGAVQMPLGETFFSPAFGLCVDRFGAPWMVVADAPEPE